MTINVIKNTRYTRQNKSARRNTVTALEQKIEATAFKIYSDAGNLSHIALKRLDDKLVKMVLEIKGLKGFADYDLADQVMEEVRNSKDYSSIVFAKCYKSAWETYKIAWNNYNASQSSEVADIHKTPLNPVHKPEPFLKHFNTYYKIKSPDITRENLAEEDYWNKKVKESALKILLEEAKAKCKKKVQLKNINVLNRDNFLSQLSLLEADASMVEKAISIYESNLVGADAQVGEDGLESDTFASDSISHSGALYQERLMMYLTECLDQALTDARVEKNVFILEYLPYYVTLKSYSYMFEQFNTVKLLLEDFLDEDLLEYISNCGLENEVDIFTEYTKLKHDTARKKLKKVQKWLDKWMVQAA